MAAADSHQVKICTGMPSPVLAGHPLWCCMPSSVSCLAKVQSASVPQSTSLISVSGTLQQPEAFATFLSSGFIFSLHFMKARDLYNPNA